MKRILASLGLGAVIVGGMIHPAIAEDSQRIHAEVTKATSSSRQTSSEISVSGTWAVNKLEVGQSFTVSTVPNEGKAPFVWNASFPFTLDDGSVVGECAANEAELTCKVTEIPESYKDKTDVTGTWWARARLQGGAIGTTEGTITLNGKAVKTLVWGDKDGTGTCTNDCANPAHYEYANPENVKFGWSNADGSISWGIKWIAKGDVEYTVKDFDAKLGTTVLPEGQPSATNHAEVNGMKLEATATVKSNGGTDGDGSVKPTPAPAPSVTPEPTPSETTPTPEPTPSTTPTPAPKPTPSETTPAPKPTPSETTPAPKPTPSETTPAPTPSATLVRLPVTGAAGSVAASAAIALLALGGFFAFWARRRAARSE